MKTAESLSIVCLSSQRWDDPTWTNKQHIMSRLAEHHRVIHLDFGQRPFIRQLIHAAKYEPKLLLKPARLWNEGVIHRAGSLYVGSFSGIPGIELLSVTHPWRDHACIERPTRMLQRHLDRIGVQDPIIWVYHPAYADAALRMKRRLLVYDCVDEYTAFPRYSKCKDWISEREQHLCKNADLVFTTAPSLFERKRAFNPDHTHYVHNVGDAAHFKRARDADTVVPSDLSSLPGPVIGFVGAISNYKLNFDWLLALARARPQYSIVLIGPVGIADPTTNITALRAQPNIHLLGPKAYSSLPAYLKGFDVAAIPYRLNSYTEAVFPIKFFEFLATGKPVVISRLPAVEEFFDAVRVADDADGFVKMCDEAVASKGEGADLRVRLAEANSWPKRVSALMQLVNDRLR